MGRRMTGQRMTGRRANPYPGLERFRDNRGAMRFYYRPAKGGPRVPLPGPFGSEAFNEAYRAAVQGHVATPRPMLPRAGAGTIQRVFDDYQDTVAFQRRKASGRATELGILRPFVAAHGHRLIAQMTRERVEKIVLAKAGTPAAANNLLKKIRRLVSFAIETGLMTADPTKGIKRFSEGSHHSWTEAEIAQFEARWPPGSFERTAFAFHLHTGQRRADVARLEWSAIDKAGVISVRQEKTGEELAIPMHRDLRAALAAWPRRNVRFVLVGPRLKPYTVESYGNMLADAIDAAGLPARCVLHGLRHAAARRLAEVGCSSKQIASITGHRSLEELERYVRAASQSRLARAAVTKLEQHSPSNADPLGEDE
jgi:integrase